MGRMVDGKWTTEPYKGDEKGRFVRGSTTFRDRVAADGSADFAPEAGRYHLYVSYACPWAHRTLIARAIKGLEHAIDVTVVHPKMTADGWRFRDEDPDPLHEADFLRDVYVAADPGYTGRVTVPVLWDTETGTIVNNESREIMRMFDHEFGGIARNDVDLAPPDKLERVEQVIDAIYQPINNGVYKCGFARSQFAYDEAVQQLFDALDHWDAALGETRFTCGDELTEADICLFTTLARFDIVYYTHFMCNWRHIYEYENLWRFSKDVYRTPGVAETCDFDHIKTHYFWSHESVNPERIVPKGPRRHLGTVEV